jgi:hypothetical protein
VHQWCLCLAVGLDSRIHRAQGVRHVGLAEVAVVGVAIIITRQRGIALRVIDRPGGGALLIALVFHSPPAVEDVLAARRGHGESREGGR